MAKRTAGSDINHTNWDQEDEPEEPGSFKAAGDDVMKNRIIKVAKRRNPIGAFAAAEEEKKSVFGSFTGFVKPPTTASSPFSFLASVTSKPVDQPKTNGVSDVSAAVKLPLVVTPTSSIKPMESKTNSSTITSKSLDEYYSKLKGLNESVASWIKKHVDANPFLNLSPIFRDYEKHLEKLEKVHRAEETSSDVVFSFKPADNTNKTKGSDSSSFVFQSSSKNSTGDASQASTSSKLSSSALLPDKKQLEKSTDPPSFVFGAVTPASSAPKTTQSFSFGSTSQPSSFSFNQTTPFTFANVNASVNAKTEEEESETTEENEDQAPKLVVEEGHIYKIRCKVFVKKADTYADKGVGSLYLKPVPSSEKVQLIVRADSNLGTLLCNFILSESIPMQRMGKKDVMLVCLPLPDATSTTPILIRVKSPEEADELLRVLEKHKK